MVESKIAVCAGLAFAFLTDPAFGTQCRDCRIELKKVATLGTWEDSVSFTGIPQIQEDGRGGFLVVAFATYPDRVLWYSGNGALRGTIGRHGEGPGEFSLITDVAVGRGDTVFIADYNRRISVLAPAPSLQYVRSFTVPATPRDLVELSGGELGVAGMRYTAEHVGFPVQLLDRDGRGATAMGAIDPIVRPDMRSTDDRRLAAARDGTLWSAHTTAYVIERWSVEGELLQRIAPNLEWFPARGPSPRQPEDHAERPPTRPEPLISGIALGADVLWVALWTADRDWSEGRARATDPTRNSVRDGLIHAVDPRSGQILAELRTPRPGYMTSTGLIASLREVPSGLIEIDLWRPRLVRAPQLSPSY